MKVIITEKPSVAQSIAAIVGAGIRKDGYLEGNGYQVTWAYGHLVTLCEPHEPWLLDTLPIIPSQWITEPVGKIEKGIRKPDAGVVKQLRVISILFQSASEIIVGMDAGREGENIFRNIYEYLAIHDHIATPYSRLWISSLTDKSIREGLSHLQPGARYNALSDAAKGRSRADWLVGMNATRALTLTAQAKRAGSGVFSIGRVQTPTLCMICKRFIDNRDFLSTPYFILTVSTSKDRKPFTARNPRKFRTKEESLAIVYKIKSRNTLQVSSIVRKDSSEAPPLLYDLTALQKEANTKYGFSADITLGVAQSLYEAKYISYPRTASRYIPEDVFDELPTLLTLLRHYPPYATYALSLYGKPLFRRSVDANKVTDHHALLPTENIPGNTLSKPQQLIYDLIVSRLLESVSAPCLKDVTNITLVSPECPDFPFFAKGYTITSPGWYAVRRLKEAPDKDDDDDDSTDLPSLIQNEQLPLLECNLQDKKTKAPALLTEATLLGMMEACGKEIDDEDEREAIKTLGIGTPATRAAIIENLLSKGMILREKKSMLPTPKGLVIYDAVKHLSVANVSLTGKWEYALQQVEAGKLDISRFNEEIIAFTRQIVRELIGSDIQSDKLQVSGSTNCPCPKCKTHKISIHPNRVVCPDAECGFYFHPVVAGRHLTPTEIITLCVKGQTKLLKGFTSKTGKSFDRALKFDDHFKPVFISTKPQLTSIPCPKCGNHLSFTSARAFCTAAGCEYFLYRTVCEHLLTEAEIANLFRYKRSDLITNFKSKNGLPFKGFLSLTNDFKTKLIYYNTK